MTPDDREAAVRRLLQVADFLHRCRGTEPCEVFEAHESACRSVAGMIRQGMALVEQELKDALASDSDGERSDTARLRLGLTTENPAVVAVMGSSSECSANGCQARSLEATLARVTQERDKGMRKLDV